MDLKEVESSIKHNLKALKGLHSNSLLKAHQHSTMHMKNIVSELRRMIDTMEI